MESEFEKFEADRNIPERRRKLLPWWIRFFSWLFIIFGGLAVIGFFAGFAGVRFDNSVYGLETNDPHSQTGLIIIALMILKGFAGFGLYFEKNWAILVAKIDAIVGILVCIAVMVFPKSGITIRLEIAFLIPYLLKIIKIEDYWNALKA